MTDLRNYSEPQDPALPASGFVLDLEHAALVITDPQVDFLSPEGVSWRVFGDSIRENDTVAHIGELLDAAMHKINQVNQWTLVPILVGAFGIMRRLSDG